MTPSRKAWATPVHQTDVTPMNIELEKDAVTTLEDTASRMEEPEYLQSGRGTGDNPEEALDQFLDSYDISINGNNDHAINVVGADRITNREEVEETMRQIGQVVESIDAVETELSYTAGTSLAVTDTPEKAAYLAETKEFPAGVTFYDQNTSYNVGYIQPTGMENEPMCVGAQAEAGEEGTSLSQEDLNTLTEIAFGMQNTLGFDMSEYSEEEPI